jgi:hypothetical protein
MVYSEIVNNQTIYLISDVAVPQSGILQDVDTVEVYKNNVLIGYFTGPLNSVTGEFTKELEFISTVTSVGTQYIFTITPTDIDQEGPYFEDGVYSFKLNSSGEGNLTSIGEVVDREIRCCMATILIGKDSNCSQAVFTKVNVNSALLEGARAAILIGDVAAATCQFEAVKNECNGC